MPVAAPPIEPAEQLLGAKSQPRELVRALGRSITADPVAIDDIDLAAVEVCGGFGVHLAMWEADSAVDVPNGVCIAGAGVDHDNVGKCGIEIDRQSHESVWNRSLSSIIVAVSPGAGAKFENCGNLVCHDRPPFPRTVSIFDQSGLRLNRGAQGR